MEELIGQLWHRCISRAARETYPDAGVDLQAMQGRLATLFRALGGDPGCRIGAAPAVRHGASRRLLARLAGSGEQHRPARLDEEHFRLPPRIEIFPTPALNADLFLWLAALAAHGESPAVQASSLAPLPGRELPTWVRNLEFNRRATAATLSAWPGLTSLYGRLVQAHLDLRQRHAVPHPWDAMLTGILRNPALDPSQPAWPLPLPDRPPAPVPLWLELDDAHLDRLAASAPAADPTAPPPPTLPHPTETAPGAFRGERVDEERKQSGVLLCFRAESLLTLGEHVRVDRPEDDDPDPHAAQAAADLERITLARQRPPLAARIRFDLDLPGATQDDTPLGPGIHLPEWNFRTASLQTDHVCLQALEATSAPPAPLPAALAATARALRQQFSVLTPGRQWVPGREDGDEADLDSVIRAVSDLRAGHEPGDRLYRRLEKRARDISCLVLADLSLSTDAWVAGQQRVIDVIREALLLFGTALTATGDPFGLYGFSSVKRQHVRYHHLKTFDQPFDDHARGRLLAIKPGYYTRMGAAIRHSANILARQGSSRRILLILSDGKPNDLDQYEGRYGIEDTRMAVLEARGQGVIPFCLTVDREGAAYLPHLFGQSGFAILHRPEDLPERLPRLYAQLTRT